MTNPPRVHTLATMINVRLHSAQKLVNEARTIADELLDSTRSTTAGSLSQGARMAAPKGKRPLTRALNLVKATKYNAALDAYVLSNDARADLIEILGSRDASSDTPDTKRRHGRKRAAKKARARR